jgi:hypothetical protein
LFLRGKDGNWWFVGIYSNKFIDRYDTVLSSDSHKNFISFLDESGFRPVVTIWHEPKMSEEFWLSVWRNFGDNIPSLQSVVDAVFKDYAFAKTEQVIYMNGFSVVLAKIYPDKVDVAKRLSERDDLGMSHGFLSGGFNDNITSGYSFTDEYYSFEFTVLPRHRAANRITNSLVQAAERSEMPLDEEKRKFMEDILGRDLVDSLNTRTSDIEQALELLLRFRDENKDEDMTQIENGQETQVTETPAVETPVAETAVVTTEAQPEEVTPVTMQQIYEFMNPLRTMLEQFITKTERDIEEVKSGLATKDETITVLQQQVRDLGKTSDEKIAEQIAPQNYWAMGGYRASAAADNVVDPKKAAVQVREEAPQVPESSAAKNDPITNLMMLPFQQTQR